jgi:hypothetical protein
MLEAQAAACGQEALVRAEEVDAQYGKESEYLREKEQFA